MSQTEQLFDFSLPSDPNTRQRFKSQVEDVVKCMSVINSQNDTIKETLAEMSKEYELPKDVIRNLATSLTKETFSKNRQKTEAKFEFVDEYTSIFNKEGQ